MLHEYKTDYIGEFNNGVTLLLYSLILTKGVPQFLLEVDDSEATSLIGTNF